MTPATFTSILGPLGIEWGYNVERIVRTRNGRTRAFVSVWVYKHMLYTQISPASKPKRGQRDKVEVALWGTAPRGTSHDQAEFAALKNCFMWMGLFPEESHPAISEVVNKLGPLGLAWSFNEEKTVQTATGLSCTINIEATRRAISLDDKGAGTIEISATATVSSSGSTPEDIAMEQAVLKGMQWLCVVPDDMDVMNDFKEASAPFEISSDDRITEASSSQMKKGFFGSMTKAASILGAFFLVK